MDLTPASDLPLPALSTLFARCFEGYFVPIPDAPLLFEARVRGEHISLVDSRVARVGGEAVGLVLMARRGRVSRVAGMGLVPAWRNRKLGGAMLRPVMEEARVRGDTRMLLEVIEQNATAMKLYEGLGFQRIRRLVGFVGTPRPEPAALQEVEPIECAWRMTEDVPWQLAPATLAGLALPARAYRLDTAVAVVGDVTAPNLVVRALAVEPEARGRGAGRRLLRALAAAFPGKPLVVSPIVPEGPCERFFLGAGLTYMALAQLELAVEL